MDGKAGAEELIAKIITDPNLLQALTAAKKPADETTSPTPTSEKEE
jgi:type VI secretion system protein ImpB